jgi:hypothetical protein
MILTEVTNPKTSREFIDLPRQLYKNDPNWICPLDNDVESVFDPKRNVFFSHGVCTRWLLKDDAGKTIGRVAAFINYEKSHKHSQPTGGMGFFESINDEKAAFLLFDTARDWLKSKGMQAMEGPINFGENDKWWGLLVDGFKPPSLGMNYNPPYYQQFFENYGFKKEYDQLTNFLDYTVPMPERFTKIAEWVMKKPGYSFRHFNQGQFDKFAKDFSEIYNDAWSEFENFAPIQIGSIRDSFRQMKPIMNEKIIWFAYYNDEPIGFVICLPDVNQILKHVNGKLDLIGKLKFLWYKRTTRIERLRIIIMGCKKKYQNHGIESAMIRCLQIAVNEIGTIKGGELAWVGDWNEKMLAIHYATGAKKDKVHRTYNYIISGTK